MSWAQLSWYGCVGLKVYSINSPTPSLKKKMYRTCQYEIHMHIQSQTNWCINWEENISKNRWTVKVATPKNWARTANPNLPVDMKEGVSPHHLLLGSNRELLNVNPGPKIYKEDIKFYINKMKQNGNYHTNITK